jgi:hypothetical protein
MTPDQLNLALAVQGAANQGYHQFAAALADMLKKQIKETKNMKATAPTTTTTTTTTAMKTQTEMKKIASKKALLKATIKSGRPEDNGKRVTLKAYKDRDGKIRWYGNEVDDRETFTDCEVSGDSLAEAKDVAERAWSGDWDLRATWL